MQICGVVSVLDRLAGGGAAIERAAGAPYVALTHDRRRLPRAPRPSGRLRRMPDEHDEAGDRSCASAPPSPEDVPLLLELFRELAEYEHLADQLRGDRGAARARRCSASARRPRR